MTDQRAGYYIVDVELTSELLGGPSLKLQLGVNAPDGTVSGTGSITQPVTPPGGEYTVWTVTGRILQTGFGPNQLLVHLTGTYGQPPAQWAAPIAISMAVDNDWNGTGSFTFLGHTIAPCKVANVSSN